MIATQDSIFLILAGLGGPNKQMRAMGLRFFFGGVLLLLIGLALRVVLPRIMY